MMSLATWQQRFAASLRTPGTGHHTPDRQQGIDVYRNNVRQSLVDALSSTFPHTRRLLGERFFDAVANDYVRHYLPAEPRLIHYGERFAEMLGKLPTVADYPYVIDICRLERARLDISHAADAEPLEARTLAEANDPGALRCMPCPASCLLRGNHDVLELWRALERGEVEAAVGAPGSWYWLLARHGRRVEIQPLTPACRTLYQLLRAQPLLGDALYDCARHHDQATTGEALGTLLGLGALTLSHDAEVTP